GHSSGSVNRLRSLFSRDGAPQREDQSLSANWHGETVAPIARDLNLTALPAGASVIAGAQRAPAGSREGPSPPSSLLIQRLLTAVPPVCEPQDRCMEVVCRHANCPNAPISNN